MTQKEYQLTLTIDNSFVVLFTPNGRYVAVEYGTQSNNQSRSPDALVALELAKQCLSADESLCKNLYGQIDENK